MKFRALTLSLVGAFCLCGQKRFSWQDACFNNPGAPYCPGHEFAVKPAGKNGLASGAGSNTGTSAFAPSTIDAAGFDWRFADPSADALAVLNCRKLLASPHAHGLIDQLGGKQGVSPSELQNIFRELSSVGQAALSVRENRIVLMVVGRAPDSVLPAPESGWTAVALGGNALLIGHADAVNQAVERILKASPLGELASVALQRPTDNEFWAIGSVKLAGHEATTAGVKRFSLAASINDHLTSDTTFELTSVPDANAIQPWLNTLGEAKIEGNIVHAKTSVGIENSDKTDSTPISALLGAFMKSARNFPVRDSATTVHTKPVIYGLEEGAREVKGYVPAVITPPAQAAIPPAAGPVRSTPGADARLSIPQVRANYRWVIQSTAIGTAPAKYSSFYYETATDQSVEKPLTLTAGAAIVGVFPDDCTFSVRNELGNSLTFRNEAEAKAMGLGAGTWSVFPQKCSGVAVFLK